MRCDIASGCCERHPKACICSRHPKACAGQRPPQLVPQLLPQSTAAQTQQPAAASGCADASTLAALIRQGLRRGQLPYAFNNEARGVNGSASQIGLELSMKALLSCHDLVLT